MTLMMLVSITAVAEEAPMETPRPPTESVEATPVPASIEDEVSAVLTQLQEPPISQSFMELHEKYPEMVGWLKCGHTIDYPVMHRPGDNDYYLHHDYQGKSIFDGALFVDGENTIWPTDRNLIIWGHNLANKRMFFHLSRYLELKYLKEYPLISYQTKYEENPSYYVPIAMFHCSLTRRIKGYFDLRRFSFTDQNEMLALPTTDVDSLALNETAIALPTPTVTPQNDGLFSDYLKELRERSLINIPVDANENDQLLILVTCSYTMYDGRFVLVTRKLRDNETAENMELLVQESTRAR